MSRKPFSRALPCAAAITSLAMLAVAQRIAPASGEGVARLKDVHGNVLVSKESGLASGDEALRLGPIHNFPRLANSFSGREFFPEQIGESSAAPNSLLIDRRENQR